MTMHIDPYTNAIRTAERDYLHQVIDSRHHSVREHVRQHAARQAVSAWCRMVPRVNSDVDMRDVAVAMTVMKYQRDALTHAWFTRVLAGGSEPECVQQLTMPYDPHAIISMAASRQVADTMLVQDAIDVADMCARVAPDPLVVWHMYAMEAVCELAVGLYGDAMEHCHIVLAYDSHNVWAQGVLAYLPATVSAHEACGPSSQ